MVLQVVNGAICVLDRVDEPFWESTVVSASNLSCLRKDAKGALWD